MTTTGSQLLDELQALPTWKARSAAILAHVRAGDVPSWVKSNAWFPVDAEITDGAKRHTLRYFVQLLAVGTDDDYVEPPMTPLEAQSVADFYNAILPTRRMVLASYKQAARKFPLSDVKVPPYNVPLAKIETVDAVRAARNIDRNRASYDPSTGLQQGQRKAVVIGPGLDGSRVAIYGGAGGNVDSVFWQPYSTIHDASYADYSHGIWLVSRRAILDGSEVDIATLFTDPVYSQLVSDQGTFVPRFPNKGLSTPTTPGGPGGSTPNPKPPPPIPPGKPTKTGTTTTPTRARLDTGGSLGLVVIAVIGVALLAGASR